MKKAYTYIYYKLYKFSESAPSKWLSDWKASLVMDTLIYFLINTICIYYKIYINPHFHFSSNNYDVISIVLIISGVNYFVFNYQNKWKEIIAEFDKLPRKANNVGSVLVAIFIVFIVVNLLFAYYQMSLIDWSKFR